MTLAWSTSLAPSHKLVLMALADIANDDGVCWPSVRLLAKKCCLCEREVRRVIDQLKSGGLLRVEERFRADGSQTSNRYLVLSPTGGGDNLSGGSDDADGGGGQVGQAEDDIGDIPVNHHSCPSKTSPQTSRGGGFDSLVYPASFSAAERVEAARRLHGLPTKVAQEVLFELDGRIQLKTVKNPLRYLGALSKSAKEGTFTADLVERARAGHERRTAVAESISRDEAAARNAATLPVNLDRLPPRLREIVAKHVKPAANATEPTRVTSEP
jgi:hypothetical protein